MKSKKAKKKEIKELNEVIDKAHQDIAINKNVVKAMTFIRDALQIELDTNIILISNIDDQV